MSREQWREQWNVGEQAIFTYSFIGEPDPDSEIAARLIPRTGQIVTVIRFDNSHSQSVRAELPTIAERVNAGELLEYRVRFLDGHEDDAFEDELTIIAITDEEERATIASIMESSPRRMK